MDIFCGTTDTIPAMNEPSLILPPSPPSTIVDGEVAAGQLWQRPSRSKLVGVTSSSRTRGLKVRRLQAAELQDFDYKRHCPHAPRPPHPPHCRALGTY